MIRLLCIKLLLFTVLASSLAGCGSGNGGESDPSLQPKSVWDSFIWDQDKWE